MSKAEVLKLPGGDGAPMPPDNVLEALFRLEPNLCVGFSRFALDWTKRPPTVLHHERTRRPLEMPRWYLVLKTHDGRLRMLFRVEDAEGKPLPLDARLVQRLLGDLLRRLGSPQKVVQAVQDAHAETHRLRESRMARLREDVLSANRTKISEVFEGNNLELPAAASMRRDGRIVSYPGQGDRSSHHENITMTPQERGWELPDYAKELGDE